MLMTVTAGAEKVGALDTIVSGPEGATSSVVAVGGARVRPLPYPFATQEIAASGTKQLPVHPRDMRFKQTQGVPFEAGEEWNQAVQSGMVASVAIADQTGVRDVEERLLGNINDGI